MPDKSDAPLEAKREPLSALATDQNVSPSGLPIPVARGLLANTPGNMPLIQQDVPNRLSDLAMYASLVATCVITLNVLVVKVARRVSFKRSRARPMFRSGLPHR